MHDVSVLRTLKGGSFSRTEVIQTSNGALRVRKSISRQDDREFGLVRWQSQIRKLQYLKKVLPEHIPDILEVGADSDFFFYDIAYFEDSTNLYEHLKHTDSAQGKVIFDKVQEIMNAYSSIDFGVTPGAAALFYHEEIDARLRAAEGWIEQNKLPIFSESERQAIADKIRKFRRLKAQLNTVLATLKIRECLTHGNLTLENILYDSASGKLILIDPYGETYCESILGDYSQLLQSCDSNYEQIIEESEHREIPLLEPFLHDKRDGIDEFNNCLHAHLDEYPEGDRALVDIFHGGQFIRMFPFKVQNSPRLAYFFLLHGLKIIMRTSDVI